MSNNGVGTRILKLARQRGILRAKDLSDLEIPRIYLSRLVESGRLVKLERGLYSLPNHQTSSNHSLALAGRRVPHGVVCLLSALQYHQLTTQAPWQLWLGIEYGGRSPKLDYPPLQVVRYSAASFSVGLQTSKVEGVKIQVFSPAKTIADCFKYRRLVGQDVALEALKAGWQERRFKVDELLQYARINRVGKTIGPYLEAIL